MTSTHRPPSLARNPSYLAAQVSKAGYRMLSDRLAVHDLRPHHFAVLAAIDDQGPRCQQDLCDVLDVDKSHMVGFVDDLEDQGYLTRDRDPDDRRRYRLAITDTGTALLGKLHDAEEECQQALFGVLDDQERHDLAALLDTVVAHADAMRLSLERCQYESRRPSSYR